MKKNTLYKSTFTALVNTYKYSTTEKYKIPARKTCTVLPLGATTKKYKATGATEIYIGSRQMLTSCGGIAPS